MFKGKTFAVRKCAMCNANVEIKHRHRLNLENVFCSQKCSNEYRKQKREERPEYFNCVCPICGKKFHLKRYRKDKCKNNYCSKECFREAKKIYMKGTGNHQYGLKGSKNASWKSDRKITNYGYIKIRCLEHPFKDVDDMVFEHRLIAEKYLLNEENSIIINGNRYLKPDYVVHHKDKNKKNNDINNLEVMTLPEHTKLHRKDI